MPFLSRILNILSHVIVSSLDCTLTSKNCSCTNLGLSKTMQWKALASMLYCKKGTFSIIFSHLIETPPFLDFICIRPVIVWSVDLVVEKIHVKRNTCYLLTRTFLIFIFIYWEEGACSRFELQFGGKVGWARVRTPDFSHRSRRACYLSYCSLAG